MLAPPFDREAIDQLIGDLADRGFGVLTDAIAAPLVDRLVADCIAREDSGEMARAAIGREEAHTLETRIRRVDAAWLDGRSDGEAAFLALAEQIRSAINRRLYLGLFEFEAQFLTYPPGGFYARHLDSLRGTRNRIVSMVVYLNSDWEPAHGGELDIWSEKDDFGPPMATVAPRAGTMVLMLSEEIPHAVRSANAQRRVIAGWFRVNASTGQRADPAR
ncbi:MAG: 2OG-Fe(II) oxygenase [Hyphomicrobiaceae bacterium]|nr:2OG-Fe(II) oxygenase [Hyphomicrobiaceae bacterium]MCC0007908.1 2OG-Fe(II) oxygenase [Hyphomicrobiaceae bacterium]